MKYTTSFAILDCKFCIYFYKLVNNVRIHLHYLSTDCDILTSLNAYCNSKCDNGLHIVDHYGSTGSANTVL